MRPAPSPLHREFVVNGYRLGSPELMVLAFVPAVITGLALFLNRTAFGVAIRAAADNQDRAQLGGIPIKRVSTVVWALAVPLVLALLAATGAVLVWLGRARGWLVLAVAAALSLLGLLGVAVVFGGLGGGSAFATALLLLTGPVGALVLATRPEVRAWTTRRAR